MPRYECQRIHSSGAILVIIWCGLVQLLAPDRFLHVHEVTDSPYAKVILYDGPLLLFCLLFPTVGLYADLRVGRFKTLIFIILSTMLAVVLLLIGVILVSFHGHSTVSNVLFYIGLPLYILLKRCFGIVALLFGMDQLNDAPSHELTSYFQWTYCTEIFTGWCLTSLVKCTFSIHDFVLRSILFLSLHILFLVAILVSCCLYCKQLVRFPPVAHGPFTLIAEVLNYARKNKHCRNQSALTYWEEQCPSRIDLGKDRFGGPFPEEQVEDVKTFFQLLLLIGFVSLFQLSFDRLSLASHLLHHGTGRYATCVLGGPGLVRFGVTFIVVALNQFVEFPMLSKHFPSMLKKIGFGFVLLIATKCCLLVTVLYGQTVSPNSTCLLTSNGWWFNSTRPNVTLPVSAHVLTIPMPLTGFALAVIIPVSVEFICAQSPQSMKGILVGLWISMAGLFDVIGHNIFWPFKLIHPEVRPSCDFYYYLSKCILLIVFLVTFCLAARWYKLRKRQTIYNAHYVIAEHCERDIAQRELLGGDEDDESTQVCSQYGSIG